MQKDQLDTLREKVEEQNRLKNDFLNRVNHAMRTPLTSILGYCELLLSPSISKEEQASFVRVIQHNGTHLLNLIGDLLQLTEIESNALEVHNAPCSPRAIVEGVVAAMSPAAAAKKLDFNVEYVEPIPAYIDCDQKFVTQILLKLVDNAIKYTEVGEVRIVVTMSTLQESSSYLQFKVIDTAGGVSSESIERLFQIFSHVEPSVSKRHEGIGVGLAIAKKLADLIKGQLTYHTNPGLGSCFTLTLQTRDQTAAPNIPKTIPMGAMSLSEDVLNGKNILLVEDNDDARQLFVLQLTGAGANVVSVENGLLGLQKGLEALQKNAIYDAILMDIEMPEMSGIEATQKLRAEGYHAPIIALTAYNTREEENKCLKAGCNQVLIKPIAREALIKKLIEAMSIQL